MATTQDFFPKKKYRPRNQPLPIINWGQGRLNKYESIIGFATKFCRLNRITPKQFRDFWSESIDHFCFDDEKEKIKLIARILNEPFAVVRTVFWDTDLGWGKLSVYQPASNWDKKISYCAVCLAEGYHGYFHMCNWLRKCPIHLVDLTIETLPFGVGTNFDRSVNKLGSLLELHCPGWEISKGNYFSRLNIKKLSTFQKFLRWHKDAQISVTEWSDACFGVFGYSNLAFHISDGYSFRHLDQLIGRLSWISPLPKQIFELFVVKPLCIEPNVQFYDKNLADEILAILLKFPFRELLHFYKYANFVKGELHPFQKTAEQAINSIISQHDPKKCMCTWGRHQNDGWCRFEAGVLQDYWPYKCPYECAANELHHEWLDVLPETTQQRIRSLDTYEQTAYAAIKTGIATMIGRTSGETLYGSNLLMEPILKFNWSDQITLLIEEILTKVVVAHVDELKRWLLEIELGSSPINRDNFPPSIYLVQRENSKLQLISWPTGEQQ